MSKTISALLTLNKFFFFHVYFVSSNTVQAITIPSQKIYIFSK